MANTVVQDKNIIQEFGKDLGIDVRFITRLVLRRDHFPINVRHFAGGKYNRNRSDKYCDDNGHLVRPTAKLKDRQSELEMLSSIHSWDKKKFYQLKLNILGNTTTAITLENLQSLHSRARFSLQQSNEINDDGDPRENEMVYDKNESNENNEESGRYNNTDGDNEESRECDSTDRDVDVSIEDSEDVSISQHNETMDEHFRSNEDNEESGRYNNTDGDNEESRECNSTDRDVDVSIEDSEDVSISQHNETMDEHFRTAIQYGKHTTKKLMERLNQTQKMTMSDIADDELLYNHIKQTSGTDPARPSTTTSTVLHFVYNQRRIARPKDAFDEDKGIKMAKHIKLSVHTDADQFSRTLLPFSGAPPSCKNKSTKKNWPNR